MMRSQSLSTVRASVCVHETYVCGCYLRDDFRIGLVDLVEPALRP